MFERFPRLYFPDPERVGWMMGENGIRFPARGESFVPYARYQELLKLYDQCRQVAEEATDDLKQANEEILDLEKRHDPIQGDQHG